jgi:hypothetical protein
MPDAKKVTNDTRSTHDDHAPREHSATPYATFTQLEAARQREWLFRRYRTARPAWKRD